MVYFLMIEVHKGYSSIQVTGKRSDIDNYHPIISYLFNLQISIWKNSRINSLPIYQIIIFCLSTNLDSMSSIQQLQPNIRGNW